jgi:hypothetical protein
MLDDRAPLGGRITDLVEYVDRLGGATWPAPECTWCRLPGRLNQRKNIDVVLDD